MFEIPLSGAPSVAVSLDGGADARDGMVALEGHSKKLVAVACSTDGNAVVSASEDGTARVWDAASRQTLHVLRHPKAPICDIALVPRARYSGQGRGDRDGARKRAKASPAPTFSKFLIGPGDRSGLKPWQGAPITIAGAIDVDASDRHRRPFADETRAAPALGPALDADAARDELAKTKNDVRRARDEVEEWKKLYTDLKSLVDRKLVDAE